MRFGTIHVLDIHGESWSILSKDNERLLCKVEGVEGPLVI